MSPITRAICGVLGVGGVAAIAFNAIAKGGFEFDSAFFTSLIGGFIFLYAAFFGTFPWGGLDHAEGEEREMSKSKWQKFWIVFVTFLIVATGFLAKKGVFQNADIVVLALVFMMFVIVGIALYFFIRSRTEDVNIRW
jgi:nicotinamide riboside transporter PnuC